MLVLDLQLMLLLGMSVSCKLGRNSHLTGFLSDLNELEPGT